MTGEETKPVKRILLPQSPHAQAPDPVLNNPTHFDVKLQPLGYSFDFGLGSFYIEAWDKERPSGLKFFPINVKANPVYPHWKY